MTHDDDDDVHDPDDMPGVPGSRWRKVDTDAEQRDAAGRLAADALRTMAQRLIDDGHTRATIEDAIRAAAPRLVQHYYANLRAAVDAGRARH